jgi:carbon-monoxide dehydrogenase small subunit
METYPLQLKVNGDLYQLEVTATRRLLDVLREDLGLKGAKEGCGAGECGACSVLVDGVLVNSCLVLALEIDGREVTTIEGIGTPEKLSEMQKAFVKHGAIQCGFCTPGMILAATDLLNRTPQASREQIREGMSGNLCRCTGYNKIVDAIQSVAKLKGG